MSAKQLLLESLATSPEGGLIIRLAAVELADQVNLDGDEEVIRQVEISRTIYLATAFKDDRQAVDRLLGDLQTEGEVVLSAPDAASIATKLASAGSLADAFVIPPKTPQEARKAAFPNLMPDQF